MRVANPGDRVLSFAKTMVSFVGTVTDFAVLAPQPAEFGALGAGWANNGWLLPVRWERLLKPVRPASELRQLAPLLPSRYSPIQSANGKGNQKMYLAEISVAVFDLLVKLGNRIEKIDGDLPVAPSAAIFTEAIDDREAERIRNDDSLSITERKQSILARRGQGRFRSNVEILERRCRVTGLTNESLLIASHIKPWRFCVSSVERLDGHNGLLLAPHVDRLFDRGFISFEDDGKILVSSRLVADDIRCLGLEAALANRGGTFTTKHAQFLEFHRAMIYLRSYG
jgi:hypothetical protein